MATCDYELLQAARRLLVRRAGRPGKLPGARVRRSVSTSYYALFHFLSEEVGLRILGTHNDLRRRRRILARTLTHTGLRITLDKVRGANVDPSVEEFLQQGNVSAGPLPTPSFVQKIARAFLDAFAKRQDADYDLNKSLSEEDARLLRLRVSRAIEDWRSANTGADQDFKHGLCVLLLLKGQLRKES